MIIFLLILMSSDSFRADDDDQRLIDLLPESDKQEFLERVARRLREETEVKISDDLQSREVNNEELDQHGEFVKKILADESSNLRRQHEAAREYPEEKSKGENEQRTGDEGYIDLTLRNSRRTRRFSVDRDMVMKNNPDQIAVQTIYDDGTASPKVTVISGKSNDTEETKELSTEIPIPVISSSDEKDIQVRQVRRTAEEAAHSGAYTKINDFDPDEETTKSDIEDELRTTTPAEELIVHSNEADALGDTVGTESTTETTTTIATTNASTTTKAKKEPKKKFKEPKINSKTQNHTMNVVKLVKQKHILRSQQDAETSEVIKKVSTENNAVDVNEIKREIFNDLSKNSNVSVSVESTQIDLSPNEPTENPVYIETTSKPDILTTTGSIETENYLQKDNIVNIAKLGEDVEGSISTPTAIDKENDSNILTTTPEPHPSVSTIDPKFKKTAKFFLDIFDEIVKNNATTEKASSNSMLVVNNFLKALRNGLQITLQTSMEDNSSGPVSGLKKQKKIKKPQPYVVFEIPPDEPAFIKKKTMKKDLRQAQDQVFYAPTYFYSPENAYFNPYNRQGPNVPDYNQPHVREGNIDDDNLESQGDQALRKFKFHGKPPDREQLPKPMPKNLPDFNYNYISKLPYIVQKPQFTEVYYNPNDYLDTDYYYGRAGPDRTRHGKTDIPHEGTVDAKGFLSDVRNILYQYKFSEPRQVHTRPMTTQRPVYFPPLPKIAKKINLTELIIFFPNHLRRLPENDEISADYYYGRSKDDEKEFLRLSNDKRKKHHKKGGRSKTADDAPKTGTVREILSMVGTKDVFPTMDKLLKLKVPLGRRLHTEELKPYLNVIKDMIRLDNRALSQYDWLGTTVEVQAAIQKLTNVIEASRKGVRMHPADTDLLKYIEYVFTSTKAITVEDEFHRSPLKNARSTQKSAAKDHNKTKKSVRQSLLPRNEKKERNSMLTKSLIDRVWLYVRGKMNNKKARQRRLDELQEFVNDLQDGLYDLHSVLKSIAVIIRYGKQSWMKNLKELYLRKSGKKECLEVMLHLFTVRFLDLVENSARRGLDYGYMTYIKTNPKDVKRTKKELAFLMKILQELKSLKDSEN